MVVENLVTNFAEKYSCQKLVTFTPTKHSWSPSSRRVLLLFAQPFREDWNQIREVQDSEPVKLKAKWAFDRFTVDDPDPNRNFVKRLVAFACVEGIMFSASFCSLFWLKSMGLCPALTFSNELISATRECTATLRSCFTRNSSH